MTQAGTQPPIAPPVEPVQAAIADEILRDELVRHALARLGKLLADRPLSVRVTTAEDAVQDTIKRALDRRAAFNPERATTAGWVHGILDHVLSEHCRALRKQPAQQPTDGAGWDNLATKMSDSDDPNTLPRLLARLSDEQRKIVVLHHLDGWTHEQIAVELGINVPGSRTRLARAMVELKRLAEMEVGQ